MAGPAPLHGVLVVDKPSGLTSHDVVAQARRRFGTRAVGHAGTLDPMATGVLLLLFGEACKLSAYLSAETKAYFATVRFGASTNSLDADGAVTDQVELADGWLLPHALESALEAERSRTEQIPPDVSAIQQGGERAYVLARRGAALVLPPRPVRVLALTELERCPRELVVDLRVSKGYYVRAFARDLGARLGVPAHLASLRRHASGGFSLDEAVAWPPAELPPLLDLASAARRALPVTELDAEATRLARQGKRLAPEQAAAARLDVPSAWLSPDGELIAIGVSDTLGHRVLRGFAPRSRSAD